MNPQNETTKTPKPLLSENVQVAVVAAAVLVGFASFNYLVVRSATRSAFRSNLLRIKLLSPTGAVVPRAY